MACGTGPGVHLIPVKTSLGALPKSASLRTTGYLAVLVGSMVPAAAAIAARCDYGVGETGQEYDLKVDRKGRSLPVRREPEQRMAWWLRLEEAAFSRDVEGRGERLASDPGQSTGGPDQFWYGSLTISGACGTSDSRPGPDGTPGTGS